MSQTSSGPPDTELLSPDSPSLHEQGIIPDTSNTAMDTSLTVTREDLANTDFLLSHPAPRRLSEPSIEYLLFFEELLKEAASLYGQRFRIAGSINSQALPKMCAPRLERKHLCTSKNEVGASAQYAHIQEFPPPISPPQKN
ncbi:hypothetical protein CDAR_213521 [Caerostris darwini]|uniref:Uncharacterized protein n=1 Tax=Caerostris darwini TaxID=1538125 RepID=A0AAV4T3Q6_9ARAC|nr:hypothetical protein CDAR_213521 [Caerostris darwini]